MHIRFNLKPGCYISKWNINWSTNYKGRLIIYLSVMITEITAYILQYCRYRQDKPLEGKWRRKFDREATMEESSAANRSISNTFCSVMVIVKAKEQLHWNHLQVSLSGGGILRFITAQCLVSCNCSLLGIARNGGHQTVFARTACCCPSITRACVRACVCVCVRVCLMPGRMTAHYTTGAPVDVCSVRAPWSSPIRRPGPCVIRPSSCL